MAVFHVNNDEVVAGETGDFGEGGRESKKEEAVEGFAITEARFEVFEICWG